jgi:hypothetical protein
MVADKEDTKSSTDQSDDDDEEMHKRKRALTRKIDRRILPLLSYVFYTY